MTTAQLAEATARLEELERKKLLPAETIRELKAWWRGVVHREQNKIVDINEWRKYAKK